MIDPKQPMSAVVSVRLEGMRAAIQTHFATQADYLQAAVDKAVADFDWDTAVKECIAEHVPVMLNQTLRAAMWRELGDDTVQARLRSIVRDVLTEALAEKDG
jgi:hypothetical protein